MQCFYGAPQIFRIIVQMSKPAPIALFVYRRPDHLARVLATLNTNKEVADTALYIFSDGAKDEVTARDVAQVRVMIREIKNFARVHIVHREHNFGLARNIMEGVTQVLSEHEELIVLEDDILVGEYFLRYMNDALALYRKEERVASITGYCYPVTLPVEDTFFIRGAECWSWATWRDRWATFNRNGNELLTSLYAKNLTHEFDYSGNMYFTQMLKDQIAGRVNSWAIRWHASCFLREMLTLYPGRSLVQNIGFFDPRATHTNNTHAYDVSLFQGPVPVEPKPVVESKTGREAFRDYFARNHRPPPPPTIFSSPAYKVQYSPRKSN
jgi:glycosyltransferase involved in cell wall biosynthesis